MKKRQVNIKQASLIIDKMSIENCINTDMIPFMPDPTQTECNYIKEFNRVKMEKHEKEDKITYPCRNTLQ